MNTLPTGNVGSSILGPWQHEMLNTRTNHCMTSAVFGDSNSNVGNVSNSYNNTINVGIEEESLQIQEWLSPLEPCKRHQDVRNCRLDGVGEWVLRRSEFESWRMSQDGSGNRTLLCFGAQGVGKTYIRYRSVSQEKGTMLTSNKTSSLVIDTLRKQTRGRNIAVLFLYCDYQTQRGQPAVNMIGSLVRQAASRAPRTPSEIKSAFDESKKEGGDGLQLPDMVKLFVKVVGPIEAVYLCVDAVDEVLPQHRLEFLHALRQIVQEAPNVRLFLTGRPYIHAELDSYHPKGAHAIHIVADRGDITRYLSRKIDNDDGQDPGLMTEDLKNDIMKTMLERASEM